MTHISTFVDVRAAGGAVSVTPGTDILDDVVVILNAPGNRLELTSDEARTLGVKLIEAAHKIEQPSTDWP